MTAKTIPLPDDPLTLDLLATCFAQMFEIDRRRTAEQGNELADPSCSAADDTPAQEQDAGGFYHNDTENKNAQ